MSYDPPLKPLKIHQLIGERIIWTDELWDEALEYLLGRVGTVDAMDMSVVLHSINGLDRDTVRSPHKVDYLRQFRDYPPTLLLGIFDLVRSRDVES